jgi:hypothetical protein
MCLAWFYNRLPEAWTRVSDFVDSLHIRLPPDTNTQARVVEVL